jgi:hypothetical protein
MDDDGPAAILDPAILEGRDLRSFHTIDCPVIVTPEEVVEHREKGDECPVNGLAE